MYPNLYSRREILSSIGMGFGAAMATSLLPHASAAGLTDPLAIREPHFPSKIKHVIHIFANGGPSHVDTFDRKVALETHAGQTMQGDTPKTERPTGAIMPSPYKWQKYGQCGLEVSELFAKVGEHADDLCVIRSMYADVPNHEPSLMLMNTGESRLVRPSVGSWVTYGLGSENHNLPAFVAMCPGGYPIQESQNWQSGFLPGIFQGTYIDTRHETIDKLIENIRNERTGRPLLRKQLDYVQWLNARHAAARGTDPNLEAAIRSMELAYNMQEEAAEAFDVMREPEDVRQMYGQHTQGRQMLIARRLVERGVRFVQVWHGQGQPWDNHDHLEKRHRELAVESDQAIGALLTDLKRSGLAAETLVIWGGEFGRTPTVEMPKDGSNEGTMTGRDHNHYGFSMWLFGGGIKGGTVYGATDELGFKAAENRVHVHDLHATMLHILGFDHQRLTYRWAGRDFRLTDVHGNIIRDILA